MELDSKTFPSRVIRVINLPFKNFCSSCFVYFPVISTLSWPINAGITECVPLSWLCNLMKLFLLNFFFFLIWSRIESLISWRLGYLISVELDLTFSYAFSGLETATKAITLIHQGCWHVDRKNSRADVKTGNLSFRINPVFRINFLLKKKKKRLFWFNFLLHSGMFFRWNLVLRQ